MTSFPKIPYQLSGFPSLPPSIQGTADAKEVDLLWAASKMGDSSMFGGPQRPLIEILWRCAMIRFALDAKGSRWHKSKAYGRLDPTEKASVSYFLGMVQACFMATSKLGVTDVVHVDAVLRLRGDLTSRSRPDLVGYRGVTSTTLGKGRVLLEAKGRSGDFAPSPIIAAKSQLSSMPPPVARLVGTNYLSVASLAYFAGDGAWASHLEDPPSRSSPVQEVGDQAYLGLLNLASIQPIAAIIGNLQRVDDRRVRRDHVTEMIEAELPDVGVTLGMPVELYEGLRQFPAGIEVSDDRAASWNEVSPLRRAATGERRHVMDERRGGRDFLLDDDGILIDVTVDRSDLL